MHAAIVARWRRVSSLYVSCVDKSVIRAHPAVMTDNKTPDDATGDGVILARVHTFLTALLAFLGFGHIPDATVAGMLDELTGWLNMAKAIRRDPQGATARIWWDAFKEAWKGSHSSKAAESADVAAAEFGKRFLPIADDGRDTFDTADFEALRVECDRLDANIALLESKNDDLQHNLDTMAAERSALLKANAHHANEIEALRHERDELKAQLAGAIVPLPKPECVEEGQRWAQLGYVFEVLDYGPKERRAYFSDIGDTPNLTHMLTSDNWHYLGTEAR